MFENGLFVHIVMVLLEILGNLQYINMFEKFKI